MDKPPESEVRRYARRVGNPRLLRALDRIDEIHAEDPSRDADGRAKELVYAERMTAWLSRLVEGADESLEVAVRAQHLARWRCPRAAFPDGRVGYLAWRKNAQRAHAEDVGSVCRACGYDDAFVARVAALVLKKARTTDAAAQTLEDCACLVFLAHELDAFVAKHAEEKVIEILRKSWGKMSEPARAAALGIAYSERGRALVTRALA